MWKVPNLHQFAISIAAVSAIGFVWGGFTYNCLKTVFWIAKNPNHFKEVLGGEGDRRKAVEPDDEDSDEEDE